jgi:hypothetical protein
MARFGATRILVGFGARNGILRIVFHHGALDLQIYDTCGGPVRARYSAPHGKQNAALWDWFLKKLRVVSTQR